MIYMIATIENTAGKLVGFRILDTVTRQTMDTSYKSMVDVISSGKAKVENLRVKQGMIYGHNGIIERYPIIRDNTVVWVGSITIIGKTPYGTFVCSDFKGELQELDNEYLLMYAQITGRISNGKIVKYKVVAIEGTYSEITQEELLEMRRIGNRNIR